MARTTGRTAALPAPRVRKVLPLRKTTWFVYRHGGKVLLERRPSNGIWGGLWCFPEKAVLKAQRVQRLEPIEHGFTHFRLRIQPLLCEVASNPPAGGFWVELDDARHAAIPAPVKTFLQDLQQTAT
jgi:A/G-specific adenine glycosylase